MRQPEPQPTDTLFQTFSRGLYKLTGSEGEDDILNMLNADPNANNSTALQVPADSIGSGVDTSTTVTTTGSDQAGKKTYDNTAVGYILGVDPKDGLAKFFLGNTTAYINWDGTTLTVVGGVNISQLNIPDQTTASSFHVDTAGNAWWGTNVATGYATAPAKILATGAATFTNVTVTGTVNATGGYIGSATALVYESQGINAGVTGYIRGGATDYLTGTGFFLGYSGAAYKFSVGNPAGNYIGWDGTTLTIIGNQVDVQTFDSTGTWTKPTGAKSVVVQAWGGGGGGGSATTSAVNGAVSAGGGGGAGDYNTFTFAATDLTSTVAVTIATAAGNGTAGGSVTFGAYLTAYGGGAGLDSTNNNTSGGGGGGGIAGVGANSTVGGNGAAGGAYAGSAGTASTGVDNGGFGGASGGGGGGAGPAGGSGTYGGGGGGGGSSTNGVAGGNGGNGIYGAGGGGGGAYNAAGGTGGTSLFGGAGANGGNNAGGSSGTVPGGGGGGAGRVTAGGISGTNTGGSGAKGRIKITSYL